MNTNARWQRMRELFHACLDLDQAQQEALLTRECAGDPELKAEVESLLASLEASKTFMESPAAQAAAPSDEPSWIGRTLGVYQILSLLAAGGMGEVYRARDSRLGRDVAIKVLSESFARDPERLHRFEQEARAVAALFFTCAVVRLENQVLAQSIERGVGGVELQVDPAAAALLRQTRARLIHQDAPHQARGNGKEVRAVLPAW